MKNAALSLVREIIYVSAALHTVILWNLSWLFLLTTSYLSWVLCKLRVTQTNKITFFNLSFYARSVKCLYTLSKCLVDHFFKNHLGQLIFNLGAKHILFFKKCWDSIKRVVTLVKIQSAWEASYHLTLIDNCHAFHTHVFVFV